MVTNACHSGRRASASFVFAMNQSRSLARSSPALPSLCAALQGSSAAREILAGEPHEHLVGRAERLRDEESVPDLDMALDGGRDQLWARAIMEPLRVAACPGACGFGAEVRREARWIVRDVVRSRLELEARREAPPDDADGAARGLVVLEPSGRVEQRCAVARLVDGGGASHEPGLEEIVLHLVPAPVPAESGAVGRGGVHSRARTVGRRMEIEVAVADVRGSHGGLERSLLDDLWLEARLQSSAHHGRAPTQHGAEQLRVQLAFYHELAHRHGLPPCRRTTASSGMTSAR